MIRLIILAAIIGLLYYGFRQVQMLPSARRNKMWWKIGLAALIGISLLAVVSGRMHPVGGLLAVLAAVAKFGTQGLFRLWPLLRATGQDAVFRTDHLEVRFVMRTNQLQGTVLKGLYAGEALHSMPIDHLQALADDYQEKDRKSYYLIRVFLQRAGTGQAGYQQAEHQQEHQQQATFSGNPSRDEALLILGLSGDPSEQDIIAAHRRLIQKLHPDRGGNDYLAARVNQAKDVLLKKI